MQENERPRPSFLKFICCDSEGGHRHRSASAFGFSIFCYRMLQKEAGDDDTKDRRSHSERNLTNFKILKILKDT
jgi:hypothetical protein